MREYFENSIEEISGCSSAAEVRVNVIATTRLLLQQSCYGLLEWLSAKRPVPEIQPAHSLLQSMRVPSDGTLVEALEELLYCCERSGWTGAAMLPSQGLA